MMNKEFIPYKQALALKELGFNDDCFATYDEDENFELQDFFQTYDTFPFHIVAAPTFSQAFRWLYQKLEIKGTMPLEEELQVTLLKELIDKVSSKYLLV